jgi:hypothetical protein
MTQIWRLHTFNRVISLLPVNGANCNFSNCVISQEFLTRRFLKTKAGTSPTILSYNANVVKFTTQEMA